MPSNTKKKPQDRKPKASSSPQEKYAATSWGSAAGEFATDLEVPSGQLCRVRRPGVQRLIEAGVISSMDSLSGLVQNVLLPGAEGKPQVDTKKVLENPQAIDSMLHVVDRVVCHTVIAPTVVMAPNDVTSRQDGVIYTDMIDLEDKLFIFQFVVGGTRDLEQFREESSAALGGVHSGEGDEDPAQ